MKHHSLHLTVAVTLWMFLAFHPCLAKESSDLKVVVDGNTRFAFNLYQKLKDTEGNLSLSPYSISTALAMTYAGARENTARQMAETMHFSLDQRHLHPAFAELQAILNAVQQRGKVTLHVANSLWPQKGYPFLKEYLSLTEKYYGVTITPVDYKTAREAACKMINAWVEDKTEKKIRNIIQPDAIDVLTRLVLVNSIYFKGNWANQFMKSATEDLPFHLSQKESVIVPMMYQKELLGYGEYKNIQILELPYIGNDLSMLVLLPKEIDALADLEKSLTVGNLDRWSKRLHKEEVNVFLPRFKMVSQFYLGGILESMGMKDAFNRNRANFSGMDGNPNWLYIAAVIHKTFVEVNEEGTEAAAATEVTTTSLVGGPPPLLFRADHPFLFLIQDNTTGSILFIGRVVNPATG